jgi:uncharacterized protein YukE
MSDDPERLRAFWSQLTEYIEETATIRHGLHRNLQHLNNRWRDKRFAEFEQAFERTCRQLTLFQEEVDRILGRPHRPQEKPGVARWATGPEGLRRLADALRDDVRIWPGRLRTTEHSYQELASIWCDGRYTALQREYIATVAAVNEYCKNAEGYAAHLYERANQAERGGS